eukprot:403340013
MLIKKENDELIYQQLAPNIFHIPGENPNAATLLGTNCFIIGSGKHRVMIDAGDLPPINDKFMRNLKTLMKDQQFTINKIFISHAIPNHFGGAWSVLEYHARQGWEIPTVYKHLDGNDYEIEVFHKCPHLREHMRHVEDKEQFQINSQILTAKTRHQPQTLKNGMEDDEIIEVMRTPGHRNDHCSYALKSQKHQQNILFSGDMVLGSPSVSMDHMELYLNDLHRAQEMKFDKLYLVHTLGLNPEDVVVEADKKIQDYLDYRYHRLNNMINFMRTKQRAIRRIELFDYIYGHEDLIDKVRLRLVTTCFDSHIQKLIDDKICMVPKEDELVFSHSDRDFKY